MAVRSSTSLTLFLLVVCHSEVRFLTSATAATQCPACFKGLCNLSRNYTTEEVVEVFDAFYPNLLKYVPDTSGNVRSDPGAYGQGRMAEWLRYWTLNHEILGSSPAIH